MPYADRKALYGKIGKQRSSAVLCYVTGDRPGLQTMIAEDAVSLIADLLKGLGASDKLSLVLYTRGGNALAAWSLVRLLREYTDDLEVLVPAHCHSGGTLICLGANRILMSSRATLGPIDPSISTPLNPTAVDPTGKQHKVPISVEDVAGFIEMAKKEAGLTSPEQLAQAFMKLAENVHPLALGKVQRARDQIQGLARKLLNLHMNDDARIENIIRILCSEAGSHDYVIYRTEARDSLKLNVVTPAARLVTTIDALYDDIRSDLALNKPYDPGAILGAAPNMDYEFVRCFCETSLGSYRFIRRGRLEKQPTGQVSDTVAFEGWELHP